MMRCASIELQKALMDMESRKHGGYSGVYIFRTTASVFLPLLCAYHCSRTRSALRVRRALAALRLVLFQPRAFTFSAIESVFCE
jgi:hypothetical protein